MSYFRKIENIGVAESGVPSAVSDGSTVKIWYDLYGQQVIKGYNTTQEALDVNVVESPEINSLEIDFFPTLTAPANTTSINVSSMTDYSVYFTVSSINTNVVVSLQGSYDNGNWGTMSLNNTAVPNVTLSNNQMTVTANGTYVISSNQPAKYLRFSFVSESGGTAAAITPKLFARDR